MLNKKECKRVFAFGYQLALLYSKKHNVLFEFSPEFRVGEGGLRRFDILSKFDAGLVKRSFNNEYFNDISIESFNDISIENCNDIFSEDFDSIFSKILRNGFIVWDDNNGRKNPEYIISVGIKDFSSVVGCALLSYECAVASIVIEMAHEMRHLEQYDVAKGKMVKPDNMLFGSMWSLVAVCDNYDYKDVNYNYVPHEIDAEKVGVLDSVDMLRKYLGESIYKQAISQALRRSNRLDIGPVKYGVVPERFSQDWFLGCIDKAVELSCVRGIDCLSDKNSLDFAVKYFLLNKQDYETFKSLSDGFEQDVYLAKMNIDFNENQYGFFDRSSLSFPESVPEPCGGRVNRPIAIQSNKPLVNVETFNVVSASDSSLNKDDRSL